MPWYFQESKIYHSAFKILFSENCFVLLSLHSLVINSKQENKDMHR